jgi:cytochrome c-type biogenesis protein CcmE
MKKSHIFGLIIIAVAIGLIISTAGDASTYVSFGEAYDMAQGGNAKHIHVVGQLKKDADGNIVGITPGADKVSFSFLMVDDSGKEQRVVYNSPMPNDLPHSEKVVVVGSYKGNDFLADKILLKCPSKYQETKLNAGVAN